MKILIKTTILSNKNLQCVVYYDNQEIASDTIETIALASSLSYIFPWFLNLCRPIFDLPLALFIDVKIIGDKTISDQLLPALQAALNVIQGTRKALLQTSKFEILSQGFQANLFLNLGETLFVKRIYETIHERDPENNFYDPCHFLNDLSDKSSSCINLDGLLETIFEKRIAHVYIHNFSLLNHYLASHQIHLPTIFEKLGIELIILDFDTYDQREGEIFLKSMLHSNSSRHYCVMPHIESYWDKKMGLKNIHYFTFPYKIENKPFDTLQEDYSFMITTWARLKHLFHFFQPLLLFMSYVDFSNPFLDYQILTHGLTYLIKNTLLPLALKMRYFTLVSNLYYQANSLLKFETLQKINTKRPVYLYGEDDWNIFFPEYYQGQAQQNDLNKMLSEKSFVQILMNPNYSYLENNPMFIRMLNAGNPYLGFSSVLRTPSLEGMSALEFSSPHQLNQKLEEMPQLILNKELLASKESLAGIVNHSVDDFYNHLLARQDDSINNDFHKSIQPYESLLDQHFATLFESQKDRLQECLTRLLREDFQHITPETFSTLIERPYFQKMIPLYHQFKENP